MIIQLSAAALLVHDATAHFVPDRVGCRRDQHFPAGEASARIMPTRRPS